MNQFKAITRGPMKGCEERNIEDYCFETAENCKTIVYKVLKTNKYNYSQHNHLIKDKILKKQKKKDGEGGLKVKVFLQQTLIRKNGIYTFREKILEEKEKPKFIKRNDIFLKNHRSITEEEIGQINVNNGGATIICLLSEADKEKNKKELLKALKNNLTNSIKELDEKKEELKKYLEALN